MSDEATRKVCAVRAIITPHCRRLHGDAGAFEEASERCRRIYEQCLEGWRGQGIEPNLHLVLEVEYPAGARGASPDVCTGREP